MDFGEYEEHHIHKHSSFYKCIVTSLPSLKYINNIFNIMPAMASVIEYSPEERLSQAVSTSEIAKACRSNPSIIESRSVLHLHTDDEENSLTSSTLLGDNKMCSPYAFLDNANGAVYVFYFLGSGLAGHKGMMHGGLAAILLDECMGRACFPLLPNQVAVTATMEITYRAPMMLPGIVLVIAKTDAVDGRKAWVGGNVTNVESGQLLMEAKALFIEPRGAEKMSKLM